MTQPEVHIHRSLDTLPVFVRAGAIVPEQPLVESTDEKPQGPLTLRVYPPVQPGKDCTGSLYLDDGQSYAFQKGEFLRVAFTCHATAQGLDSHRRSPPWQLSTLVESGLHRGLRRIATRGRGQRRTGRRASRAGSTRL